MDNKVSNDKVSKVLNIVEFLSNYGPSTIIKISQFTNIPKSSIFKILVKLEENDYTYRDKIDTSYYWYLTFKILKISQKILARLDIKQKVRSILEELSKSINEIVQLCILNNNKVLYIDIIKRTNSIISYADIGTELDINLTAAGPVLCSGLDLSELSKLLKSQNFKKNTIYTLDKYSDLMKRVKECSLKGYSYDNQEYAIGIRCISAPIYNYDNKIVSAVIATGHVSSFTDKKIKILTEKVIEYAQKASYSLGYKT